MISMTFTTETRDQIAAALVAHAADPRVLVRVGFVKGRISKSDYPAAIAALIRVWPADFDGFCRASFSDLVGTIIWRAMAIYDMAAGRGLQADLAGRLGVGTEDAYAYVRQLTYATDRNLTAYNSATRSHSGGRWTSAVQAVVDGTTIRAGYGERAMFEDFGGSEYGIMLGVGLVLPVADAIDDEGTATIIARPSSLFLSPVCDVEPLDRADEEALDMLVA
ncbi:hypothetical protein [Bradyrhizobium elkanii]|uniref:Uncharacterized protein n=2 Tax=Bradyrhizobium TaxID=374 RepID=A0A8I1Y9J4_BRAEL|nr:hypothetical protein [Bradyrhizobium elkanii]MBP1294311.1 hypothetical protein [Bradyrhizobium elkanii]